MPKFDDSNQSSGPLRKSNSQGNTSTYDSNRFMWNNPESIFNSQKDLNIRQTNSH